MTEIEKYNIFSEKILLITFGGTSVPGLSRARLKSVADGDRSYFQFEKIIENKAYHSNISNEELEIFFNEIICDFKDDQLRLQINHNLAIK